MFGLIGFVGIWSCLSCVSFNPIKDILDASKTSRDIDIDADFDIAIDVYSSILYVYENVSLMSG